MSLVHVEPVRAHGTYNKFCDKQPCNIYGICQYNQCKSKKTLRVYPSEAGVKSLFSGASIGKIEGCSFTFNPVDDSKTMSNKDLKQRKLCIIISDDSDPE